MRDYAEDIRELRCRRSHFLLSTVSLIATPPLPSHSLCVTGKVCHCFPLGVNWFNAWCRSKMAATVNYMEKERECAHASARSELSLPFSRGFSHLGLILCKQFSLPQEAFLRHILKCWALKPASVCVTVHSRKNSEKGLLLSD